MKFVVKSLIGGKGELRLNKIVVPLLVALFTLCVININNVNASVRKEQILFEGRDLYIRWCSFRYSGPYWISSGKTITIEWVADRLVTVYILNDVDYRQWSQIGGPLIFRTYKTAQQGTLEYYVNYADNFYVVVMGYAGQAAKLYHWKEKLVWYENDPQQDLSWEYYVIEPWPIQKVEPEGSVPEFPQLTIIISTIALMSVAVIVLTHKMGRK